VSAGPAPKRARLARLSPPGPEMHPTSAQLPKEVLLKRTVLVLLVVEERESEPPRTADVSGETIDEAPRSVPMPKPALTKCPSNVVPLRKIAQ